jgi:hypothetical protein
MPEMPSVTPPVSHGSWGAAQAVVRASKGRITNRCEAAQTCCGRIWDGRLEDSRRNLLPLEACLLYGALPYPQGPENKVSNVKC